MRTVTALSTATAALLAAACSAKPPTYCGDAIAQQSVFVGEQVTIEPCFEDPGGGTLKLAAASSDESVARAFLLRDNVGVGGVSPGEAQVTITATNEDDQSVETSFSVLVPNRAPEFISDLKEADVIVNRSLEWNLAEFFEEPDREEMTFEAASSNSAVGVNVDGSVAEVFGLTAGASQITLTAKDPHGSEGTGTIEVTVKTPVTLIEDDFDTEASLDDWTYPDTMEVSVQNGLLRLRYPVEDFISWAIQEVDEVTEFYVEVTMMPVAGGLTGATWDTGSETGIPQYFFLAGTFTEDRNWLLANAPPGGGPLVVAAGGNSDLVELDEFGDYLISVSGDNIVITRGAGEIFNGTIVPGMISLGLTGGDVASEYDRVTLSAILSGDRAAQRRKIALSKLDRKIALPMLDMLIKR